MKLDKLSIFGVAIAIALIFLQMQYSAKNRQDIEAQEVATESAIVDETSTSSNEAGEKPSVSQLPEGFFAEEVTLENKDAIFKFSTATGAISRVEFPDQHEVNQLEVPVSMNRFGTRSIGGLETHSGKSLDSGYKITNSSAEGITFIGTLANGAIAQKEWRFIKGDKKGKTYRLDYKLTIENPSENIIEASNMNLFIGGATPLYKGELPDQSGFYYLGEKGYKKIKSNPLKKSFFGSKLNSLEEKVDSLEFAGVGNQFFTCFTTPAKSYTSEYFAQTNQVEIPKEAGGGTKNEINLAISLPRETIEAKGGKEQFDFEVYVGPKHFQTLKEVGSNAGLVMNYGFFKPISGILNNILTFLHNKIFSNFAGSYAWGLSIIALTVVIRGVMWPLHNVSARSMKRMSKLQPKIKELKEKYPDDPQRVQTEQMKLFGEYGINPMGGCLPMLGQIPIFFGLFTMLKSAVEFRHEKFLWINDLSQPDTVYTIPFPLLENGLPINVLPILMFITMAIQMSMNPPPTDPTQKVMMRLMPLMMVVFCYNFASALALYWTTSNVFTIFQTWLMKKLPEPELKKKERGNGKAGSLMERLQKKAEELEKQKASASSAPMRDAKPKKKRGPKTGG